MLELDRFLPYRLSVLTNTISAAIARGVKRSSARLLGFARSVARLA